MAEESSFKGSPEIPRLQQGMGGLALMAKAVRGAAAYQNVPQKVMESMLAAAEAKPVEFPRSYNLSRPVRLLGLRMLEPLDVTQSFAADKFVSRTATFKKSIAASRDTPGIRNKFHTENWNLKLHACPDAWELREKDPDYVPVIVEKDARSDLPDIPFKKYHVHGEMPLGELVYVVIRAHMRIRGDTPIFVSFKNTEPPSGALMSAVDEENKGEDGFLHMTYGGEENACGSSINHELEWRAKTWPTKRPRLISQPHWLTRPPPPA